MPTTDVDRLVEDLTREEKLRLVRGVEDPEGTATGYLPGVERLDVPPFRLVDGPMGVRVPGERATAFPSTLALAATFDPALARRQGATMAREAKARGQDVLLGPGTNVVRVPHCGRNFEYFSEDPHLSGAFAAGVAGGIEGEDVVATAKHYVANNQETDRASVSAEVSERALREIYLPAFRSAVEAGAGAVMTAYNRVNGTHMSDHAFLVGEVLKGEWGFDGFVMSDWYGLESTVGAANAGLDLEMPGVPPGRLFDGGDDAPGDAEGPGDDGEESGDEGPPDVDVSEFEMPSGMPDVTKFGLFGDPLAVAIDAGDVPEARLDDMVRRVLGGMDRIGLLDGERSEPEGAIDAPEHRELAEEIAARGTVLLENDGVLPIEEDADVAVVGPNVQEAKVGGGGSSETEPFRTTSPVEGVTGRARGEVTVARGVPEIEDLSLFDMLPGFGDEDEEVDGADEGEEPTVEEAVAVAEDADVAVVFVRDATTEAIDRDDLGLPGEQDELVEAVAAANDRTVVVVNSGGPVELPWREEVAAVLEAWYPGQADGAAVASVLYGDRDPSGRLPVTFAPEGTYPATEEHQFPGVDGEAHYEEGVFVGYRHFDAADVEPTYPFGHGHSYATFAYGDAAAVDDSAVEVTVENTADRAGREVVQAYVRPPDVGGVERPVRELAGFAAVGLDGGESRTVTVDLDERALARYDEDAGWTTDPGTYAVEVGRSSRDARAEVEVER